MKKIVVIILSIVATCLVGCKKDDAYTNMSSNTTTTTSNSTSSTSTEAEASAVSIINNTDDFIENSTFQTIVSIVYSGNSATVTNPLDGQGVTIANENGYITITSSVKGVEYSISGTGLGNVKIYSDYKIKISLNNLSLTNTSGSALNIQTGKRAFIVLSGSNNLTGCGVDTATGAEDEKATLFSEGQIIFYGSG